MQKQVLRFAQDDSVGIGDVLFCRCRLPGLSSETWGTRENVRYSCGLGLSLGLLLSWFLFWSFLSVGWFS